MVVLNCQLLPHPPRAALALPLEQYQLLEEAYQVLVAVVARYVFGYAIDWVEELSKLAMLALVFLVAGMLAFRDEHISFTLISDRIKGEKGKYFRLFYKLVGLVVCVSLTIGSYSLVYAEWSSGVLTESTLFRMWTFHLFMLIGFGIASFYYLYLCFAVLKNSSFGSKNM